MFTEMDRETVNAMKDCILDLYRELHKVNEDRRNAEDELLIWDTFDDERYTAWRAHRREIVQISAMISAKEAVFFRFAEKDVIRSFDEEKREIFCS